MHMQRPRIRLRLRTFLLALPLAALSACDDAEIVCVLRLPALNTVPQQLTLAPGDSAMVTATVPGAAATTRSTSALASVTAATSACGSVSGPLRNAVTWQSSNASVAAIAPIDSLRAWVYGVAHGQTTVIATNVTEPNFKGASAVVVP
jgi:hypothetical protein